jgi:hypothetical protein
MLHDPTAFGRNTDRAGWRLRAIQQRRREARQAAILCAVLAIASATGAGLANRFGHDGGAILLGLVAFLALFVGTIAAGEA